jgi:hypothetical protein
LDRKGSKFCPFLPYSQLGLLNFSAGFLGTARTVQIPLKWTENPVRPGAPPRNLTDLRLNFNIFALFDWVVLCCCGGPAFGQ